MLFFHYEDWSRPMADWHTTPVAVPVAVLHEYVVGRGDEDDWASKNRYKESTALVVRCGDDPEPRIVFREDLIELADGQELYLLRRVVRAGTPEEAAEFVNARTGEVGVFSASRVCHLGEFPGWVPFVVLGPGDELQRPWDLPLPRRPAE